MEELKTKNKSLESVKSLDSLNSSDSLDSLPLPERTQEQKELIVEDDTARYEILKVMFKTQYFMSSYEIAEEAGVSRSLFLRTVNKSIKSGFAEIRKVKRGRTKLYRLEKVLKVTKVYNRAPSQRETNALKKQKYHLSERERRGWSAAFASFS